MSGKRITWKDLNHLTDEGSSHSELSEVLEFNSVEMDDDERLIMDDPINNHENEERKMTSLLLSGEVSRERIQRQNSTDMEERINEINELIVRLEDTAAMLKTQLLSTHQKLHHKPTPVQKKQLPFVIKYQLLFVILFQAITLTLTALFDHFRKESQLAFEVMVDIIATFLLSLNGLIVGTATAILSKMLLKHTVQSTFMAQTYLATVILFSSLYFVIFRFEPESWEFSANDTIKQKAAFSQYVRMLYLSVSSATLCGAANIQPKAWYTTLIVCFQSLVNFVYFASILAQTIGNYNSYTVQIQRRASINEQNTTNERSSTN